MQHLGACLLRLNHSDSFGSSAIAFDVELWLVPKTCPPTIPLDSVTTIINKMKTDRRNGNVFPHCRA